MHEIDDFVLRGVFALLPPMSIRMLPKNQPSLHLHGKPHRSVFVLSRQGTQRHCRSSFYFRDNKWISEAFPWPQKPFLGRRSFFLDVP